MQKFIWLMLSILSITGALRAQDNSKKAATITRRGADKTFEPDPEKISRRFFIDLGKGNRLRLELQEIEDMDYFLNIDSLLMVFQNDMKAFKDSLGDLLASHRIDYVSDPSGKKKIRIQQFKPAAASYILDQGEPAALKLEQDTINIMIVSAAPGIFHSGEQELRYDRLTIYLNQYHELLNYITAGLNEKIGWLQKNYYERWTNDKDGYKLKKDPTITAPAPKGLISPGPGNDYLGSATYLNMGNYKNYFVPSFGVGIGLHFNRPGVKHEIGLLWEPDFIFSNNTQGHLQTYRNDFLVLSYLQEKKGFSIFHELVHLSPTASLSYLITRKGDYFDKHTFRLGIGGLRFFDGGMTVEPCLFFHDLFKETTPGLKLGLQF